MIRQTINKLVQMYRLYKLKKQLEDYPDQLKRMQEVEDKAVMEEFKNEE